MLDVNNTTAIANGRTRFNLVNGRTALGRCEDARSAAFRGQAVPSGTWTDLAAELDEDAGICRAVHQTRLAGDMSAAARECRFRAADVA